MNYKYDVEQECFVREDGLGKKFWINVTEAQRIMTLYDLGNSVSEIRNKIQFNGEVYESTIRNFIRNVQEGKIEIPTDVTYVPVPESLRRGRELFALRVQGESMINAGIFDGDIIIVHRTPVAENGEIVVALVEDEATVKTFYKENGHFRLQPENDLFEPIIVDEVVLLGKVISLVRNFE